MELFLPKQHGAWAMLFIPFWLGVAASDFRWQHIPFFISWILLYLGTYPLLLLFKGKKTSFYTKWTLIYMIPGLVFLIVPYMARPSIIWFGLVIIPFFSLNVYFSSKNKDRALMNDLIAILIFSIVGLASSYLSYGDVWKLEFKVFITSILFFIGCTFYIKTMIREKKSKMYRCTSYIYHVAVPLMLLLIGEWLVAVAFLPSLFRAIYCYGKPYSIKKIGILEIVNATLFFIIMVFDLFS